MFIRMLTSMVLVPLVLGALYWQNSWVLMTMLSLLVFGATLEWCKLIPLNPKTIAIGLLQKAIAVCVVALLCWQHLIPMQPWLGMVLITWILIVIFEVTFPKSQQLFGKTWVVMLLGLVMLPLFFKLMIALYQLPQGRNLIVYLLFLVWAADVGAYLSGRAFGRHKLIVNVSPGKTWEGLLGGLILAMAVAFVAMNYINVKHQPLWILLSLLVTLISVAGDLFISMLKRRCHLKDTGSIFPGHGGVLDRIDSLLAALPWFYAGLILTQ